MTDWMLQFADRLQAERKATEAMQEHDSENPTDVLGALTAGRKAVLHHLAQGGA